MANLPTLYEYYTGNGITQGLSVDQPYYTLNHKNFSLYGGSLHYFRVPPEYWRLRMRQMRAAGLNTLDTYVPWNLHEPQPGMYDFGEGGTDMEKFLNIEKFLRTAQEEDLFVMLRPGPFICAEFEFGGLPSWLLREEGIKIRTSDEKFMSHVRRYFHVLLTLITSLQFTRGGPIIAIQVENEYGSTENPKSKPPSVPDKRYLMELVQLMLDHQIKELLLTSDSPLAHGDIGSLHTLFQTANFNQDVKEQFQALKKLQPNKPFQVTEYWSGWFSHWSENSYVGNASQFSELYEEILRYPASVTLYMFHGGTNWGFLNGANLATLPPGTQATYEPDITSYDYDAPLMESGDYNQKYFVVKDLLEKYNAVKTKLPDMPVLPKREAYGSLAITKYLSYDDIMKQLPHKLESQQLLSMENLSINNNTGQQFGYIVYRKTLVHIKQVSVLKINGYVTDTVNIYINSKLITENIADLNGFGYWRQRDSYIVLNTTIEDATIDLVVCNMGRNNFGSLDQFLQFKGLWQSVTLDGEELIDWEIFPMEFKKSWIQSLNGWRDNNGPPNVTGFGLYKAEIELEDLHDTFIDMSMWNKGIVIINGFVLGRYWRIGPQLSLYLPGPLLKLGRNDIIVFEEFFPKAEISFASDPVVKSK
ncbi:unnamed protein product [Phaedon cochleariae]|uniref:Beta-galactosidase n=1 Tax=Phaedon cochleariae TaxID=80249 RepID=A0A9P0DFX6_PHACE|nr:unnamed protein product [Phaedon cochleariae]